MSVFDRNHLDHLIAAVSISPDNTHRLSYSIHFVSISIYTLSIWCWNEWKKTVQFSMFNAQCSSNSNRCVVWLFNANRVSLMAIVNVSTLAFVFGQCWKRWKSFFFCCLHRSRLQHTFFAMVRIVSFFLYVFFNFCGKWFQFINGAAWCKLYYRRGIFTIY